MRSSTRTLGSDEALFISARERKRFYSFSPESKRRTSRARSNKRLVLANIPAGRRHLPGIHEIARVWRHASIARTSSAGQRWRKYYDRSPPAKTSSQGHLLDRHLVDPIARLSTGFPEPFASRPTFIAFPYAIHNSLTWGYNLLW